MSNIINNLAEEITDREIVSTPNYYDWDCDYLIDYIVQTHHQYAIKAIPQILPLAQKVVEVYGEKYTELVVIQSLFQQLSNELLLHMKKEELVLFPQIKKLSGTESDANNVNRSGFGSIESSISVIETEHETLDIMAKRLSKLSNNYAPPADVCQTFQVFFCKLKEFEADLHMHAYLENDILHPKAIELEKMLLVV